MRDVGYNCGRIGVLIVLYILFGMIYFDLDTSDEGGVQSMVSVVFMTTIFTGIICMNGVMPVRARASARCPSASGPPSCTTAFRTPSPTR